MCGEEQKIIPDQAGVLEAKAGPSFLAKMAFQATVKPESSCHADLTQNPSPLFPPVIAQAPLVCEKEIVPVTSDGRCLRPGYP